jgi:fructokinase
LNLDEVWVAGEALIDFIPNSIGEFQAIVGGGPANTARALAKLGVHTYFIGGLSSDKYGLHIKEILTDSSVDLTLASESELRTATAQVSIDQTGKVKYFFDLKDTSTFDFNQEWLPRGKPAVLHLGTLATVVEPGASNLLNWAKSIDTTRVFDPNVRPSVFGTRAEYRASVERFIAISDVVKLSIEDLMWLYPDLSSASELLAKGPSLIVVTHGAEGLEGIHSHGSVFVPGVEIELVDTVGAGDTVGAILVESIFYHGLASLIANLEEVLGRAAKAAAITCSRAGANPPWREELDQA